MKIKIIYLCFFVFGQSIGFAASKLSADQILKKADHFRGISESHTVAVKVTNLMGKAVQDESEFIVSVKDNNTSLVEQTSPASARGKKLLMIGHDLWLRTADIKKAIRISLDQKLTGETANGDLARTNFYGDYEPTIVEDTKAHYKLLLKSKNSQTTYSQINYFVAKKDFVPFKAEFMALSGKILKSVEYAKPDKKYKGRNLITKMKISDALVKQRASVLKYSNFKAQKLEDSIFNRAAL